MTLVLLGQPVPWVPLALMVPSVPLVQPGLKVPKAMSVLPGQMVLPGRTAFKVPQVQSVLLV